MEPDAQKALDFLLKHKTGALASITTDGAPHVATVYFTADKDFSIYFLTKTSTRKYAILKENPLVAFTVSNEEEPQTVQMRGVAAEVPHENENIRIVEQLLKNVTSNPLYTAPLTKLDPGKVVLIKITPHWLRWSDFTLNKTEADSIFFEKYCVE